MISPSDAMGETKYLALGDSYTIGESVTELERWPNQLVSILSEKGIKIRKPIVVATTGWRTDNLKNGITIAKLKEEFDLVSLMIGVNNQYQGKPLAQFAIEFEGLLHNAIRLGKGRQENVFVVSIPDYGFTPFGLKNKDKISAEINQFNEVIKRSCEKHDLKYINITDISREGLNDSELIASDGLHPSGKMYALWAKHIWESLKQK